MQQYRHNHYVPISYQQRFMLGGQSRYYRLDLKPEILSNCRVKYTRKDLHHWGPANVFAQDDLYTTKWGSSENREIEQFFFGQLDTTGPAAIELICNFDHANQNYNEPLFRQFLTYMSVQKLRTPKGLEAFSAQVETKNKNEALIELQRLQDLYCATWTECVWQIAHASQSQTKFIISDHPVTVYNRACPHLSKYCSGANDPDIRWAAAHTYIFLFRSIKF